MLPSPVPTPGETFITDLCNALDVKHPSAVPKAASTPLGYLAPEDSEIRFAIHLNHPTPAMQPHISLAQLLSGEVDQPLTRRQRYRLSLTLASSFVQLQDTAWLQAAWDKRNVYFFTCRPNPTESPFVVSQFRQQSGPATTEPSTGALRQANTAGGQDVAGIACLGILLLELCFGRAIERHPNWLAMPSGAAGEQMRAGLALVAALEWLKDVNDEAGADYTEAVEWCLTGCRTMPSDGSWRKVMLEKVVEPLERCYGYLG